MKYLDYLEESMTGLNNAIEHLQNAKTSSKTGIQYFDCDNILLGLHEQRKRLQKLIDEAPRE